MIQLIYHATFKGDIYLEKQDKNKHTKQNHQEKLRTNNNFYYYNILTELECPLLFNKKILYKNILTTMLAQSRRCDRFIPSRNESCHSFTICQSSQSDTYSSYIKNNILPNSKFLNFKDKENHSHNYQDQYFKSSQTTLFSQKSTQISMNILPKKTNIVNPIPDKILDAPCIRDDFYLNNLDWSPIGPLAISLQNQVYLYTSSSIQQICKSLDGSYISSVKFNNHVLSVGLSNGKLQLYDLEKISMIRQIQEHTNRISSQDFTESNNILYTGSKDKSIISHDLKMKYTIINKMQIHRGEVCALKKQTGGSQNIASGSNDNSVVIWDTRRDKPKMKYKQHRGAVKALNWCPWKRGVIGTAGGSGDRTIKIWNVNELEAKTLGSQKTESQISSLLWNQPSNSLITSHGGRKNLISIWQIQNFHQNMLEVELMQQVGGHKGRILGMEQSKNQDLVCSYSADQTIRFWNLQSGSNHHQNRSQSQWNQSLSFDLK